MLIVQECNSINSTYLITHLFFHAEFSRNNIWKYTKRQILILSI
jgi:hypothetical protein